MFDLDSLLALRRVQNFDVGRGHLVVEVARTREDESRFVGDLWSVPLSGEEPRRLTGGEHHDGSPCCLRDGSVLFLSTRPLPGRADNKATQLWRLPAQGEAEPLSDEAQGVRAFAASDDGRRIVFSAPRYRGDVDQHAVNAERAKAGPSMLHYKTMPVRHWDHWRGAPLHLLCLEEGRLRDLSPGAELEYLDSPFALSPDGTILAAVRGRSVGRMRHDEVWILDLDAGTERVLSPEGTRLSDLVFSPSGRHLAAAAYLRRRDAPEARYAVSISLESGEITRLGMDLDRSPVPLAWIDEDSLVAAADDESHRPLFVLSREGDTKRYAEGHFLRARNDAGKVYALTSSIKEAPFVARIDKGAPLPLADLAGLSQVGAPQFRVEDVRTELSDGESIQGLVAWPDGPGPHPLLLWIHGGPIGQFADQWHWRWNVAPFVTAGFVVAVPNARGSTGRGDAFMSAIYGDWSGRVHQDLVEYTAALCARDEVGPAFAMGGSFGGYMTNWIGANPDARAPFKALVTHASLYDLGAFYGATDYPAFFGDFIGGTPWSGELERHSPHTNIGRWTTPTLILHGEKDYRVPIGEGLALFEALQAHGVESELVVFPDEGHWITKPRNVRAWYETVLRFLNAHR